MRCGARVGRNSRRGVCGSVTVLTAISWVMIAITCFGRLHHGKIQGTHRPPFLLPSAGSLIGTCLAIPVGYPTLCLIRAEYSIGGVSLSSEVMIILKPIVFMEFHPLIHLAGSTFTDAVVDASRSTGSTGGKGSPVDSPACRLCSSSVQRTCGWSPRGVDRRDA